ncbi:MAG TPA: DUF4142 domain-containing protein [Longimicrobiales bacterium]
MRCTERTVVLVLAAALVGCSGPDTRTETEAAAEEAAAPAASAPDAAGSLDDADIAAIVVAANSIDVRTGELARERASDERVRQFAETMITDHTAVNQSAQELVTRLGVTPTENEVSRSLQQSAEETRASLLSQTGAAFDRAYVAHEVSYHEAVLQALDDTLIPSAANEELRQTLVGVRPAFQAHLDHARSLLEQLGGS